MFTYGPVPSRRLGYSLGVSLIPPKTCSYSCVYCQLGRTNRLQVKRENFYRKEDVFAEIERQLTHSKADYITFVGDGEPTLSADLGWLIRKCKESTSKPVAVITNASLLFESDVRQDLSKADVVIPSLDAGSPEIFSRINRPHGTIKFETMLRGQMDFRRDYRGQIWLEVMLVHEVNDTEEALKDIRIAIDKIQPDRIYITTPIRPPAESWVRPPPPEKILRAQEIIGQAITVDMIESGAFGHETFASAQQAILEIGSRHPLRLEQARRIEDEFTESGIVDKMIEDKVLRKVLFHNSEYLLPSHFVRGQ